MEKLHGDAQDAPVGCRGRRRGRLVCPSRGEKRTISTASESGEYIMAVISPVLEDKVVEQRNSGSDAVHKT